MSFDNLNGSCWLNLFAPQEERQWLYNSEFSIFNMKTLFWFYLYIQWGFPKLDSIKKTLQTKVPGRDIVHMKTQPISVLQTLPLASRIGRAKNVNNAK